MSPRRSATSLRSISIPPISPTSPTSASPDSSAPPSATREVLTVRIATRIGSLPVGAPVILAAALLQQAQAVDNDAALDSLDHVVEGKRRHRAGGERLHLDAGARGRRRLGLDPRLAGLTVDLDRDVDVGERQLVGEWDQL